MTRPRRARRKARVPEQRSFGFTNWGGKRPGAGRKPKGERAGVPHDTRPALASRFPVHVTTRLKKGLPSLRSRFEHHVLRSCFSAGCDRLGFRLIHYSVQSNHLHLIAEAKDREALWRGLQGLFVRIAKNLNKLWERQGSVFADRYHHRILRTPREVRNALRYVLLNARRHGVRLAGLDAYSSAECFDGWRSPLRESRATIVLRARTWLLTHGWRRHGRIGIDEPVGGASTSVRRQASSPSTSAQSAAPQPEARAWLRLPIHGAGS